MVDTSGRPDDYARVAVEAWREFWAGRELDEPGVSRSVPLVDLLDEDVDLTPPATCPPPPTTCRRSGSPASVPGSPACSRPSPG
ncbi:MAG: hypothetical protein IRY84_15420 [Thermobispora bispora]|nr:hypothetical protein [Thermobispora bispora]